MDADQDIDDDTHICLKCRTTIVGLDNYVKHRKSGCTTSSCTNRPLNSPIKVEVASMPKISTTMPPAHIENDPNLKADDFFSSLELQSSAKKTAGSSPGSSIKNASGVVTRSRTSAAILACTSSRDAQFTSQQKSSSELLGNVSTELFSPQTDIDTATSTCLMKTESRENVMQAGIERSDLEDSACEEESNEEYEEEDEDEEDDGCPPRSHTGGKWKPGDLMTRGSPPSWTRTSSSSTHADEYRGSSTGGWSLLLEDCAGSSTVSSDPPPNFTGGKWRPTLPNQAVMNTQQVCRGTNSDYEDYLLHDNTGGRDSTVARIVDSAIPRVPPPGYMSGKWLPGKQVRLDDGSSTGSGSVDSMNPPLRKSGSTIQYWCGQCNRRLSSRTLYERHLLSELHFKRTVQERELEEHPIRAQGDSTYRTSDKRTVKPTEVYLNSELWARRKRRRLNSGAISGSPKREKRRRNEVRCEVCRSRVLRHLLGKHLVSHYHCRKARSGHPQAARLVLENIHSVVRQAPFQCSPCKFYCNTEASFKQHWASQEHEHTDSKVSGRYWCSFCKYECESSGDMECHFDSSVHRELVAVINRSVPVVIRKRTVLSCGACGEEFRYNAQLRRHVMLAGHHDSCTGSDEYQGRFCCTDCRFVGNSCVSLQRHVLHTHKAVKRGAYFCSACSLNFDTAEEAALHRRSQEHKYSALASRRDRGLSDEVLTKRCPHCGEDFGNVLQLKTHLQEKHSEFPYRCARCGMAFTLPQEVSRHVREATCVFRPDAPSGGDQVPGEVAVPVASTEVSSKETEGGDCSYITCSQCSYQTDSRAELLFHEVLHGDPVTDPSVTEVASRETTTVQSQKVARYQCPLCTRVFRKAALRCHLRTHTQERPFVCSICYRGFGHRSSMITHVKQEHRGEAGYVCDVCPFTSANRASMERHRLIHTERKKPFLCAVCGASFFLKNALQQHMKVHTGKDFKCHHEGCIFACRSQAELRNHQQVHSDHRPYQCDTCSYSAKTKPQLLRHHTVHLMQKPHQCPHCPFAARMASHLRRHLRLHTGAKPYRCPYCSYTCNILENLRKHVLSTSKHPGKHLYECRFCGPEDRFKSNLAREFRAHLVTTHPNHFGSALLAASYIAGLYNADEDPKFVENPIQLQPRWKRTKVAAATEDERFHRISEGSQDNRNEAQDLSVHDETSATEGLEITKETKAGTEASVSLPNSKTNQEQSQVDSEELLSMVVVTDPTDDVIYIQLPPDSDGGAMERYCESILFPTEGDAFLSVENFNKRQSSGGDITTSSNNIGCETAVMLPLGEELERTDKVKDDGNTSLIKGISTEQCPEGESEMNEMTVITVPSGDAGEYLRLPQDETAAGQGPEEPDGYQKVVTQSLEDAAHKEMTTAQQQQQQRYLLIFK